jgi:hypothetical protein
MCGKTCTVVENGCQMPECTAGSCTVLLLTVGPVPVRRQKARRASPPASG